MASARVCKAAERRAWRQPGCVKPRSGVQIIARGGNPGTIVPTRDFNPGGVTEKRAQFGRPSGAAARGEMPCPGVTTPGYCLPAAPRLC
jgi:hypothetical protein